MNSWVVVAGVRMILTFNLANYSKGFGLCPMTTAKYFVHLVIFISQIFGLSCLSVTDSFKSAVIKYKALIKNNSILSVGFKANPSKPFYFDDGEMKWVCLQTDCRPIYSYQWAWAIGNKVQLWSLPSNNVGTHPTMAHAFKNLPCADRLGIHKEIIAPAKHRLYECRNLRFRHSKCCTDSVHDQLK